MFFTVLTAVVLVTPAKAQGSGAGQNPPPGTTAALHPAPMKTYTNPALLLTFSYPAELRTMDGKGAAASGQRMVYGESALPNAERSSAPAACTTTLLALGRQPATGQAGAVASLTLFDIDLHCLPPKAAKSKSVMNTALRGFASQGVTELGMMPVSEPVGYPLDGHRAYFAASQGTPVTKTDLQSTQSEMMAVVAVAANEHILAWMLESDDLEFFNRMLESRVAFGPEPGQPLFPAGLHGDDVFNPMQ
ncbi:MAG: hypothetical protein WBD46_12825 [Acidobacteriaceae bacterium]